MTDAYLLRVAAGDRSAMRECIERYSKLVWSIALRLSPSRADAEDAVQDIFLDLWRNAARYQPERSSEATFIAVIARRRLIDRLRRDSRNSAKAGAEFDPDRIPSLDDPEITAEARIAARALGELPEEKRAIVAMSIVEGLTQEEIATKTKLPLGTVKSHLRRGLMAVREALRVKESAERSVAT